MTRQSGRHHPLEQISTLTHNNVPDKISASAEIFCVLVFVSVYLFSQLKGARTDLARINTPFALISLYQQSQQAHGVCIYSVAEFFY